MDRSGSKSQGKGKRRGKGQGVVLRRTVELPASLRLELQELGQLPPTRSGAGAGSRKARRKAARDDKKVARPQMHRSSDDPDPSSSRARKRAGAPALAPAPKRTKPGSDRPNAGDEVTDGPSFQSNRPSGSSAQIPGHVMPPKQTPLEKLLAKQQKTVGTHNTLERSSHAESVEDREIAWLEAKLGIARGDTLSRDEKEKWKNEFAEDGLEDLFDGLDDLELAAFSGGSEQYKNKSLKEQVRVDGDHVDVDDDDNDDEEDEEEDSEGSDYSDQASDSLDAESAIANSADDDDAASAADTTADFVDETAAGLSDDESLHVRSGHAASGAEMDEAVETSATPSSRTHQSTIIADGASKGRYVPPHLRTTSHNEPSAQSSTSEQSESAPEDPRLRRQLLGHLNRLSSTNMPAIIDALAHIYTSNPRAVVSNTLTSLLLDTIAGRDNLGEQLLVTYAALVAAMSCSVGIELAAGVVAKTITMFDKSYGQFGLAEKGKGVVDIELDSGAFQGRPGSKECLNLVAFISELYNFAVIGCVIVYDLVRMFIDRGLKELEVELLVKVVKRSGQQLRQDDPSALKDIVTLVKQKVAGTDATSMSSRTKFMLETLTNIKNNKIKADAIDQYSGLKKYLTGLRRQSSRAHEPLRLTLKDIRNSPAKGKWWLVGAAWTGHPLVEGRAGAGSVSANADRTSSDAALFKLARAHSMNTDVRRSIFVVLMSSEDYVDACEKLLQLGLSDVQQREIARVLLQCSGNEKQYNAYYSLVAQQLGNRSHGFKITLQYCLWDFLRELGEKSVGGEELVKSVNDHEPTPDVPARRLNHLARLYAWCIAKNVVTLAILKPIPFGQAKKRTVQFLRRLFVDLIISTQTASPALVLAQTGTRRDSKALERVCVRAAAHAQLAKGVAYFFDTEMGDEDLLSIVSNEREMDIVRFGVKVIRETLSLGSGIALGI